MNYKNKGFTLIELMIGMVISGFILLSVYKYLDDGSRNSEVNTIVAKSLELQNNIKSWNALQQDCQFVNTANVLANNLAPAGWAIEDSSESLLNRIFKLKYKFGYLTVASNLNPSWLSGSGINPNQGFTINYQTFPRNRLPFFIEKIKKHFDLIDVGGEIIKNENGMSNNLNNIYNNDVGTTSIVLVSWGC